MFVLSGVEVCGMERPSSFSGVQEHGFLLCLQSSPFVLGKTATTSSRTGPVIGGSPFQAAVISFTAFAFQPFGNCSFGAEEPFGLLLRLAVVEMSGFPPLWPRNLPASTMPQAAGFPGIKNVCVVMAS